MGLIKDVINFRKYKKLKECLEVLESEFGITKADLVYLHDALEIVKNNKVNETKPVAMDERTVEEIEKQKLKMTPEQFVEVFAKETEEFYPYGKPKE